MGRASAAWRNAAQGLKMNSNSALLADLAERYWRFECYEMPLAAALAGQTLADAVLFRESQVDHQRRDRIAGELLTGLWAINAADLSAQERATLRLLQRELDGVRSQFHVLAHLRPSLLPLGPDFMAVYWANATNIVRSTDADEYGPDSTEQLSINDYFFWIGGYQLEKHTIRSYYGTLLASG